VCLSTFVTFVGQTPFSLAQVFKFRIFKFQKTSTQKKKREDPLNINTFFFISFLKGDHFGHPMIT